MSKVLVVNKSCHDFTAAEEYGEILYLTSGSVNRYSTSNMYRQFEREIKRSSPNDWIVLSGMTIMNSVVCAMFATIHKRLNLLIWKSNDKVYIERVIKMDSLKEVNNETAPTTD